MRLGIALHAFYDPASVGGANSYVHSLLKSLLRLGTSDRFVVLIRMEAEAHVRGLLKAWALDHVPLEVIIVPSSTHVSHALVRATTMRNFLNGLSLDVLHFPIHWMDPQGVAVPTVLSAHDIQHLHFPGFFPSDELAFREQATYASCTRATTIVTQSHFIKNDLVERLKLHPQKINVVQVVADDIFHQPLDHAQLEETRRAYGLPDRFLYCPAQLWPHKNHVGLIRALAVLRNHTRLDIPLVLTGSRESAYDAVVREISVQGLDSRVWLLGAIPFERLPALYRLSRAVIVPTLYEGSSFPILEAFATGTPVIASRIPPVQELIADDALLFAPTNGEEMVEKIRRLWVDDDYFERATCHARAQKGTYSWNKTAQAMLEVYRETAAVWSRSHQCESGMTRVLCARDEIIDDLRGRLAQTEQALRESEDDRVAKERVIRELRDASTERLEALEAVSAVARKRLELIQQLESLPPSGRAPEPPTRLARFLRRIWTRGRGAVRDARG